MLISQENTACHLARPSPRSALASVSIATQGDYGRYSGSTSSITMTVKEAQALRNFLNESLPVPSVDGAGSIDV